jgi:hypothetical protein
LSGLGGTVRVDGGGGGGNTSIISFYEIFLLKFKRFAWRIMKQARKCMHGVTIVVRSPGLDL